MSDLSNDTADIADAVESLGRMLDRFHKTHGEDKYEALLLVFPGAHYVCTSAARPIAALANVTA